MFIHHPLEMEKRKKRCCSLTSKLSSEIVFNSLSQCNICGNDKATILANSDRYGFPIRTAMCDNCGLIYLLDRFSQDSYNNFYAQGHYRKIVENFYHVRQNINSIESEQNKYTNILIKSLKGFINNSGERKELLDIGGSTGLTARLFEQEFGFKSTVLEPSLEEFNKAQKIGVSVVNNTIEEWETNKKFDVILICRTFEHLYDLKLTFNKISDLLQQNGLLFCDIADFLQTCYYQGAPNVVSKIDHCFWLTKETAASIFSYLGFEIQKSFINIPNQQVGFLLKKSHISRPFSQVSIDKQIQEILHIQRLWSLERQKFYNFPSMIRRSLYRFRRNITKSLDLRKS